MKTFATRIPEAVLAVLVRGEIRDGVFFLPNEQLDRKLYVAVNEVLAALGGKWSRSKRGHVFADAPDERIESALATGCYDDPKTLSFYSTPPKLAEQLVEWAAITPGHVCLEPSAGEGALAREMLKKAADVVCIEVDERRAAGLARVFDRVSCADFLETAPLFYGRHFDRIVMNPPFSTPGHPRADIDHVEHALDFLQPGGRLVSVMSAGILFRSDRRTVAFREAIDERGGSIEPLAAGAFRESGTMVNTCVVVTP